MWNGFRDVESVEDGSKNWKDTIDKTLTLLYPDYGTNMGKFVIAS
jgi:hypothetical protein